MMEGFACFDRGVHRDTPWVRLACKILWELPPKVLQPKKLLPEEGGHLSDWSFLRKATCSGGNLSRSMPFVSNLGGRAPSGKQAASKRAVLSPVKPWITVSS